MKTELAKKYKWGFVLSEQDLRRIVQTCDEQMSKLDIEFRRLCSAKLKDGALVESKEIDDLFSLENVGSKAIQRVELRFEEAEEGVKPNVVIVFQQGTKESESWVSIKSTVIGNSRDWVFLTSANLEDRIKKTKATALPYWFSRRWALLIALGIGMLIALIITGRYLSNQDLGGQLEAAYQSGMFKNDIEALVFLERARAKGMGLRIGVLLTLSYLLPVSFFWFLGFVIPRLVSSYNFYWGDYMAIYDRRKGNIKIFWTVIVLGALVSIVSGLLLRVF